MEMAGDAWRRWSTLTCLTEEACGMSVTECTTYSTPYRKRAEILLQPSLATQVNTSWYSIQFNLSYVIWRHILFQCLGVTYRHAYNDDGKKTTTACKCFFWAHAWNYNYKTATKHERGYVKNFLHLLLVFTSILLVWSLVSYASLESG